MQTVKNLIQQLAACNPDLPVVTPGSGELDLEVEKAESSQAKVKSEILALRIKLAIIPCPGQLRLGEEN